MGNCQAAEAAEIVIQHPGGKAERLYWPTTAADVMRTNPGHYVALVILRLSPTDKAAAAGDEAAAAAVVGAGGAAKITRVKLLKPKDTLHLGQVYRLITAQEVTKALRARKNDKARRCEAIRQQHEQLRRGDGGAEQGACCEQDAKRDKDRHRSSGGDAQPAGAGRGRHWRPSLQSISEAAGQSSSSSNSISESTTS